MSGAVTIIAASLVLALNTVPSAAPFFRDARLLVLLFLLCSDFRILLRHVCDVHCGRVDVVVDVA